MAVVWAKRIGGCQYEVRSAGESIRLYTDGVFHSQWNSRKPLGGHLWDLLFLPSLFHSRYPRIDNCMLLGVGGGAVINMLNVFSDVAMIDAVDLDKTHLRVAKKYFLNSPTNVNFIHDDACRYVDSIRSQKIAKRYDYVIEDLFCGSALDKSEAVRAVSMDSHWLSQLSGIMTSEGILVANFENILQLKRSLKKSILTQAGFTGAVAILHPNYENGIGICFKGERNMKRFRRNLATLQDSHTAKQVGALKFDLKIL